MKLPLRYAGRSPYVAAAMALTLLAACGSGTSSSSTASSTDSSSSESTTAATSSSAAAILASNPAAKSVTVNLAAGQGGFNFNGYANGALTVTVPKGWKVTINCTDAAAFPHSCAIVGGAGTSDLAFPGASTPDPTHGLKPGDSATFSFTPDKVGEFRIACLVPGHEDGGMWDKFVVSASGTASASPPTSAS